MNTCKSYKLFNNEEFNIITHYDLDGVGCALLLNNCFESQVKKIFSGGYNKINQILKRNSGDNLIITDLSLNDEQVKIVNDNYNNVIWFDHHITSFDINTDLTKKWKVYINIKACATKLIYLWLKHYGFNEKIKKAEKFVNVVNDYDMWIHNNPSSILLNNLFWDIGFYKFKDEFKSFSWTKENWKRSNFLQKEKEKEIASYESYEIENLLRVTFGKKHVSDIPLFYPKEKHHIIFRSKKSLSIRSIIDLTDFYTLINNMGINGGGHHYAGGFEYSGDPLEFVELFYNYLKERV